MTKYEELIIKAENEGAEVIELNLGTHKKCGRCINNLLFVNSTLSDTDKYEILAEELAHYRKTHGDITNLCKINNIKQENIARRESYKILLKPKDIINAIETGANNIHEIADYLSISTDLLLEIFEDWKKQYGLWINVGSYVIQLEPTLGILKDFGGLTLKHC